MTVWGTSDRMWAMVEENVDGALPERWTASTVYNGHVDGSGRRPA